MVVWDEEYVGWVEECLDVEDHEQEHCEQCDDAFHNQELINHSACWKVLMIEVCWLRLIILEEEVQ